MKKTTLYITFIFTLCSQLGNTQCYPDRHSTTWFDGWISCNTSANPNSVYGDSHWIMYDLGYDYILNETKFWNTNEPKNLTNGIKDYNIDYSLDGVTWTNLGSFSIDQANGLSNYEGTDGPDFNSATARYVLITPTANYGGNCFGFSEIKMTITDPFEVIDEVIGFNATVYPNPFINNASIRIASLFEDKPVTYTLYDILGRVITQNVFNINTDTDTYPITLNGNTLSVGIYILTITQNNNQRTFKLIKKE